VVSRRTAIDPKAHHDSHGTQIKVREGGPSTAKDYVRATTFAPGEKGSLPSTNHDIGDPVPVNIRAAVDAISYLIVCSTSLYNEPVRPVGECPHVGDRRKAGSSKEHVHRSCARAAEGINSLRADCKIFDSVGIEVPNTGHGDTDFIIESAADERNHTARWRVGQIEVGERRAGTMPKVQMHQTRIHRVCRKVRSADKEVVETVIVYVSRAVHRIAAALAVCSAVQYEPRVSARREVRQVQRAKSCRVCASKDHICRAGEGAAERRVPL
jgi:hypothetical protein